MRVAWVAVLLVSACRLTPAPDDPPDYTWPPAITPDGNPDDGRCRADADCNGAVCARNGECLPASLIHAVRVTWTISGDLASPTSCAAVGDLALELVADSYDTTGYAPVPCDAGIFSIDKFPTRYGAVRLGPVDFGSGLEAALDAAGAAALDLPY